MSTDQTKSKQNTKRTPKTKKAPPRKGTTKPAPAKAEGTRVKKRPAFRNLTSKRITRMAGEVERV